MSRARLNARSGLVLAAVVAAIAATGCWHRIPDIPSYADPLNVAFTTPAPAKFLAVFETTKGRVEIEVTRDWAPLGADRFYQLVRSGFFDGQRLFRIRPKYIAQWGLHSDPAVIAAWKEAFIKDDPVKTPNTKGTIAFAFKDKNARSTQVYINLVDNLQQDAQGFAVFGRVVRGMDVVESWYGEYGENSGGGIRNGKQGPIEKEGAAWFDKNYPKLDRILRARVERVK